jgi:succinate dehydrogenase / fumarate reductase cytochrome b subunit
MRTKVNFYRSSVGQKFVMGITGIFLCTFLVVHLSGNLLLFRNDGGRSFDEYSRFMSSNLGIRAMEVVLVAGFLSHLLLAARTWQRNRRARPVRYELNRPSQNSSLASRTMAVSGSLVFLFLVVHLKTFFVPARFSSTPHASMYDTVRAAFASPTYAAFYLVALALLAFHLRHGFQSAFQTLGIRSSARRLVDAVALLFWLVIPLGFALMPIYFLWTRYRGV